MHQNNALLAGAEPSRGDEISAVVRQLQLAGVEPLVTADGSAVHACEDTLELCANDIPGTAINRLLEAAAERRLLSITVRFATGHRDAERQLEMFCLGLRDLSQDAALAGPRTGLVVDASNICPQSAWLIRRKYLGYGPLAIRVGADTKPRHWLQLWHLRNEPRVSVLLPSRVRSPCSLLATEQSNAVLPRLVLHVPASSAWVQMRLDLARFSDTGGKLQQPALDRALACCVELGDCLHDLLPWGCGAMRHDAWFNRRLAIEIDGLGRLAQLRGIDPASLAGLEELQGVLLSLRNSLGGLSLQLASKRGLLPCIEQTDPTRKLPMCDTRDDWRMRWRRAVEKMSFRHRTLVAMSPWSVVSPGKKADFRHINLLPLLADTDVVAFRRSSSIAHWNVNEFKEFHERTWAVLRKKNAASVFAERV